MKNYFVAICVAFPFLGMTQTFTKVTDSPLSTHPGDSRSVNWVDVSNDGYIDCFISNGPSSGQNNSLFLNNSNGGFTLVENDPIVTDNKPSDGASFADIDNDGDLDAFVVNWYNRHNMAYLNNGMGQFTQVTDGLWVTNSGYSETAAFGDYDNDGFVDLYVTNSEGIRRNFLYRNRGENNFENVEEGSLVTDQSASRNVSWSDIDGDGDLDLFVTNELGQKDALYKNNAGTSFEKITDVEITSEGFSTMSSSWADIDNDGDLDLFLATNQTKNQLYRNDGDFVFTKLSNSAVSASNTNSFSSAWSDIDNDGDLDLFVTNAFASGTRLKNNLYLNDGHGEFTAVDEGVVVTDAGWSYGCAFGDYDNDGFQDLAVATTRFDGKDEVDYLYHNDGNDNHWIMLSLVGTVSNRSAIGAKVRVKSFINGAPIWQMREISSQSAYCSQNDMRAHFGLGDAEVVDSVMIEWPSGIVQYVTDISINQILSIEEQLINSSGSSNDLIELNVYPNPTDSNIQINASFGEYVDKLSMEIVGSGGQVVFSTIVHVGGSQWLYAFDLKQLNASPGTYFIKIKTATSEIIEIVSLI